MPSHLKIKGGWIWSGAKKLETPEEADVWEILDMEELAPVMR
jgi:hypothetical protein